jgi:DNA-binding beta-propeller fold protein YncE
MRFLWLCLIVGCEFVNPGADPPRATIDFPIRVIVDRDNDALYVVNSNFDLHFNGATVLRFPLGAIEARLGPGGPTIPENEIAAMPGFSEVVIGSHASDAELSPLKNRLYVSVRSDAHLLFVDVDGTTLSCAQGADRVCGDSHRRGDEAIATERFIEFPTDPVGIGIIPSTADEEFVLVAHRGGRASFFRSNAADGPHLVHVLTGLPQNLVSLAIEQETQLAWSPSVLSGEQTAGAFARFGLAFDSTMRQDFFLFNAGNVGLDDVADGLDTRDIRFCSLPACNTAYVLSRRPEAVIIVDLAASNGAALAVRNVIPIGFGPSRLELAENVRGHNLLFASAYDSREVYVIDADAGRVRTIIRGMSGPFDLAFDGDHRLYVDDFRSSVVRIFDLEPFFACLEGTAGDSCEPPLVGVLGVPRPVGDLL